MKLPPRHPMHGRLRLRRRQEAVTRDLDRIYREDGELPDFQRLREPTRSWRSRAWAVSGIVFLLAAVTWGGLMLFGALSQESAGEPVVFALNSEPPVTVGVPTRLVLTYQNTGDVSLASLSVRVHLPKTFFLDHASPEQDETGLFPLGSLSRGSDGAVELFGTFFTSVPSTERIQIVASYRPANFNAEFDLIKNFNVELQESALSLAREDVERASAGETITLSYNLLNASDTATEDLCVQPLLPGSFVVQSSEPPLKGGMWDIGRSEAHSKATFRVQGSFASNAKSEEEIGSELSKKAEDGTYVNLSRERSSIAVDAGAAYGNIIVNGSAKDQSLPAGTALRVSLPWKHTGSKPIKNFAVALTLSGTRTVPVLWSSEDTNLADGVRESNVVRWGQNEREAFDLVAPGAEGVIDLVLATPEELNPARFSEVLHIMVSLSGIVESKPLTLQVAPLTIRFFGPLSLLASARYYDADGGPLGTGPLPPTVGQTTRYAIDWALEKPTESLTEIVGKTVLPAGVTFVNGGDASLGAVTFDTASREVRWSIPSLTDSAQTRFFVEVTPTENQAGSILPLSEQATVTAKNTDGTTLRAEAAGLTTRLDDDSFATDDGKVTL